MRLCITVNLDYAKIPVPNFHRTDREGGNFLKNPLCYVGGEWK